MFIFDHLFDVLILLVLALLVFGPTKMIAMGSDLGRAVRQLRQATKGMSLNDLLTGNFEDKNQAQPETPSATAFGEAAPASLPLTQTPSPGAESLDGETRVVDTTITTDEEPRLR